LKPENILFEGKSINSRIKLIDFGLSKQLLHYGPKMTTKIGTPYYVSPEVIEGSYDKICDLWSIGVIVYIMLGGYPPFNADNDNQLFRLILSGKYSFHPEDWD
jgi:calcium-dependent protein kinase